jgi:hypothetical protein
MLTDVFLNGFLMSILQLFVVVDAPRNTPHCDASRVTALALPTGDDRAGRGWPNRLIVHLSVIMQPKAAFRTSLKPQHRH